MPDRDLTNGVCPDESPLLSRDGPETTMDSKDEPNGILADVTYSMSTCRSPRSPRLIETVESVHWHGEACNIAIAKQSKKTKSSATKRLSWSLQNIKVVSFDLDDTLWSCMEVIQKAEKAMHAYLESKGHHAMVEHLKHPNLGSHQKAVMAAHPQRSYDVTFVRRKVIQRAAEKSNVKDDELIENTFQQFYHARTFHVSEHLFPGAVEAVARMKKLGLRIGTLSNGNADVFKVPELAPLVEHHVNPEIAGAAKPSKIPFEALRKCFGDVSPSEILHIGDSFDSDVRGALNAGMRACWVTNEIEHEKDDDILRVAHVSEIADMFECELLQE